MKAQLNLIASVGGLTIQASINSTADGGFGRDPSLPAGKAGTLTTRTDNNTGEATLGTGHGIQTGNKVDVYWEGGLRYGMTVGTVNVNVVPIDGGSGDNLPLATTPLTVTKQVEVSTEFDGDELQMLVFSCPNRCHIVFVDDSAAEWLPTEIVAGGFWSWVGDSGVANPLAGKDLAKFLVSNGQSDNDATFRLGASLDATP